MASTVLSGQTSQRAARRRRAPAPRQLVATGAFALGALAAAGIGSVVTSATTGSAWFEQLEKPAWYPPSAAFGIVWTVLYVMIAVAGVRAWRRGAPPAAVAAWATQMALNLGWTVVFFGLRAPGWALAEIVVLLVAVAVTIVGFAAVDRLAAWLLVPYLGWVGYATTLTAGIAWLNR